MNDSRYHDVLDRVADRGAARGADAVLDAAIGAAAPSLTARPERRRSAVLRPILVAATAAALLAGVLALRGWAGGDRITAGTTPPGTEQPYLAAGLRASFRVVQVAEGDEVPAPTPGTVQRFTGTTPTGAPADLTVFAVPFSGTQGPTPEHVRGVAGFVQPSAVTTLGWLPPGARVWASSATLSLDQVKAVVEALGARGDDALGGFDAPASPVGGIRLALTAEHLSTRDAPPVARSLLMARDDDDDRRVIVVEGYAPVSGSHLDLVSMWPAGERRFFGDVEAVVRTGGPGGWTTVSWVLRGGIQAVVRARGLTDAELAFAVQGVVRIPGPPALNWEALRAQTADDRNWRPPFAYEADLDPGHLRVSWTDVRVTDPRRETCLDVTGLGPLCGRDGSGGGADGTGTAVFGPSGQLADVPVAPVTELYSVTRDGRWFVFGVGLGDRVPPLATGAGPLTPSTATSGSATLFAVEVPAGTDHLEVRSPADGTPMDFTRPGEGTTDAYRSDR